MIEQGPTDLRLFLFNLLKNVPALKDDLVVNDLRNIIITRSVDNVMHRLFKQRWLNYKVAQACNQPASKWNCWQQTINVKCYCSCMYL